MTQHSFARIVSRILHILFIVLTLGILGISLFAPDLITSALNWMGAQIQSWGRWNYLVLFCVALIESIPFIGVVVPGMNIMILVGGFFVMRDPVTFVIAASVAMVGACIGNALGYMMGRQAGIGLLAQFGLEKKDIQIIERQVKKHGFWLIVGGKFHSMFRSFVPYIAGAHGLSGFQFWMANIVGSSIWAVSVILIGMFFVHSYEIILRYITYGVLIAVVVIVIMVVIRDGRAAGGPSTEVDKQ